jgi:hypothetical protein
MNYSGRLALIKSTLLPVTTHLAISLGLLPWVHKVLEKIMKAFLWSGIDLVHGGKCLVAWGCVQWPLALGGRPQDLWAGVPATMVVALVCRPGLRYHARRTRQRLPSLKHLLGLFLGMDVDSVSGRTGGLTDAPSPSSHRTSWPQCPNRDKRSIQSNEALIKVHGSMTCKGCELSRS